MIRDEQLRRQAMAYGFRIGQPTITKAVFCLIDLCMARVGGALEMIEDGVVIGSSAELDSHRIMYILGEN